MVGEGAGRGGWTRVYKGAEAATSLDVLLPSYKSLKTIHMSVSTNISTSLSPERCKWDHKASLEICPRHSAEMHRGFLLSLCVFWRALPGRISLAIFPQQKSEENPDAE